MLTVRKKVQMQISFLPGYGNDDYNSDMWRVLEILNYIGFKSNDKLEDNIFKLLNKRSND